ncbi:unnamed protein product [Macrosiphum euphorbiae]|uniref:Secreted protein n=1 Tax=Macrosiphum euphorbiae TaxID=13131 RepID=A0AAV0XW00_9HEMI|nr:unnamed protein product [Macrosiphum euphorbiae]
MKLLISIMKCLFVNITRWRAICCRYEALASAYSRQLVLLLSTGCAPVSGGGGRLFPGFSTTQRTSSSFCKRYTTKNNISNSVSLQSNHNQYDLWGLHKTLEQR